MVELGLCQYTWANVSNESAYESKDKADSPVNLQMLLLARLLERLVKSVHYFLVRSALEGYTLAFIVEA